MKRKPLIGVNLDYYPAGSPRHHPLIDHHEIGVAHSPYAHHVINTKYLSAIESAGGVPVLIPHAFSSIADYTDLVDGFLFTGGLMDIPPDAYGEEIHSDKLYLECRRASFDLELGKAALETGKPVLGICSGLQLLTVLTGGTLHQHVPDVYPSNIDHFAFYDREQYVHDITIKKDTKLHRIMGIEHGAVNSAHHMAVKSTGPSTTVTAHACDGVPEAIECAEHPFLVGVQWHPEFLAGPHFKLFEALVGAAGSR